MRNENKAIHIHNMTFCGKRRIFFRHCNLFLLNYILRLVWLILAYKLNYWWNGLMISCWTWKWFTGALITISQCNHLMTTVKTKDQRWQSFNHQRARFLEALLLRAGIDKTTIGPMLKMKKLGYSHLIDACN